MVGTAHLGLPGLCLLLKPLAGAGQLWWCFLCPWQISTGAFRLILRCRNLPVCAKFWPLSHCWKDHNLSRQPLVPRSHSALPGAAPPSLGTGTAAPCLRSACCQQEKPSLGLLEKQGRAVWDSALSSAAPGPTAAHSPHRSLPAPCSSPSCVPGVLCDTTPYATVRSPGPGHHPQNWSRTWQHPCVRAGPCHPHGARALSSGHTAGLWPEPGDSGDSSAQGCALCSATHTRDGAEGTYCRGIS